MVKRNLYLRKPGGVKPAPKSGGTVQPVAAQRPAAPLYLVRPENGFGTAALVCGIVGLFVGIAAPLAVIFAAVSLRLADQGRATNRASATWGAWLGGIGTIAWLIGIVAFFYLTSGEPTLYYDPYTNEYFYRD